MRKQLLTIFLFCAALLAPLTMRADDAATLAAKISSFNGGSTGSLSATVSSNTVTVTGTLTGVSTTLTLNIDAGVTVVWKATIVTGSSFPTGYELISLLGAGTFNVTTGGYVDGGDPAIAGNADIIVSGTGQVLSASDYGAIQISGNVTVMDNAQINATVGGAIRTYGTNSVVNVSGGKVTCSTVSSGTTTAAIYMDNSNNTGLNVIISGTGVVEASGDGRSAILTSGSVEVSGGEVSATTDAAIYANGVNSTVTVSGTGKVQATNNGTAINTFGMVEVKDNAQVSSDTGTAIRTWATSTTIGVSGGMVKSNTGIAISADGENSFVAVSGGTVSSGGSSQTIYMSNSANTKLNVLVSGTGTVEATGDGGIAIQTFESVRVSGGAVSATTGTAIAAYGDNSSVTVSDGTVSATTGTGIIAWGTNSSVTVSGTGKVETTGNGDPLATQGPAISVPFGSVEIKDNANINAISIAIGATITVVNGGTVSSANSSAIYSDVANAKASIRGGTVTSGGSRVIFMDNSNNTGGNVAVNGTGKVQATGVGGTAIETYGGVEIASGEVSATDGTAINAIGANSFVSVSGGTVSATTGRAIAANGDNSFVSVSGPAKIQTTGDNGTAILTWGSVAVSGSEVKATGDRGIAISCRSENSKVTVSGIGKIEATGNDGSSISTNGNVEIKDNAQVISNLTKPAIYATSENSTVTVSGGMVSGGNPVIFMWNNNNTGLNVIINGGTVRATVGNGTAIYTYGNAEVSGGEVSATTGYAIYAAGSSSTVKVDGGLVFAYSDAIANNVISLPSNPSGFTSATGSGIVIGWDQAAGNTSYIYGSTVDISQSPTSATVQWSKNETDNGISYVNGTNTGFIPLNVTVNPATVLGDISGDGTIDFTDLMALTDQIYGVTPLTGGALLAADVNHDGTVDFADLMAILDHIYGVKLLW